MNSLHHVVWLAGLGCGAVALSCSGEPFCEDTQTCAAGAAGATGDAGSVDSNEAGAAATAGEGGSAGQLGEGAAGAGVIVGEGGSSGQPGQGLAGNAGTDAGAGGDGGLPIDCTADADCDDGQGCNGLEACSAGACVAGEGVECPSGMQCSEADAASCAFTSDAPWVVYAGSEQTPGLREGWAVKLDLVGNMDPIKHSPALEPGYAVVGPALEADASWSPDAKTLLLSTARNSSDDQQTYAVRFGAGLPQAPVKLSGRLPKSSVHPAAWSPQGDAVALWRDDGLYVVDYPPAGVPEPKLLTEAGFAVTNFWWKAPSELIVVSRNAATKKANISLSKRGPSGWSSENIESDLALVARFSGYAELSPDASTLIYQTEAADLSRALYAIETVVGAAAKKLSALHRAYVVFAPNSSRFSLLEEDPVYPVHTSVWWGEGAAYSATPVPVQAGIPLALEMVYAAWSQDSSRMLYYRDSDVGRQLMMYQNTPKLLTPLDKDRQRVSLELPSWSPGTKWLAVDTQADAYSDVAFKILTVADLGKRKEIQVSPQDHAFRAPTFSSGDEFLVYTTGTTGGGINDASYVDLRSGLNSRKTLPGPGAIGTYPGRFVRGTTAFIYTRSTELGGVCLYFDLAGKEDAPLQVNRAYGAYACGVQPAPR